MNHNPLEDVHVAILAGGLATRLGPITKNIPKSLVPVCGKPFLSYQLELLRNQGIKHVTLCLGYLGENIKNEFGDGKNWSMQLEYSFDGEKLLGTGGALRKALSKLGKEFFVLYGDSYLTEPYGPILDFFKRSNKHGLMTIYNNKGLHDKSNIFFKDGSIEVYDKKNLTEQMQHIDYGLSLFQASVFEEWPTETAFDLAEVMQRLIINGDMAGFEVKERFYEIGSPKGLAELESLLKKSK
jgi:NDP-sugar pyrophosphorylase family protein